MVEDDSKDIFDDIDRLMDRIEEEIEGVVSGFKKDVDHLKRPFVKGFSLGISPDGSPFFKTFGDYDAVHGRREPLTEQTVGDDFLSVILEVPGVEKEDIHLEVAEESLAFSAKSKAKEYRTEVQLKETVDPDSAAATYRNGVLEVRFKLKGKTNKGYKELKVQ
ncbi:MAG: Hsp20/alpha crystallin family protein [Nitrososphaerota archaeon]|nr:Hsp20/alpha crystallin family protein [Nitrososphaerota archaeon]MDG6939415.1 Hsp20/alpha crystallin family protein [Nitrososphaerota archaeon]